MVNGLKRFKGKSDDLYSYLGSLIENTDVGSKNLIFTPWMIGERSPINDPNVRGGFYNLSLDHTREDMLRSVCEGVAYNLKWSLLYMEKLVGRADDLNCIGGGAKSDVWCQILANILGRKIVQMENPELAAAKGSAINAMVGLKVLNEFSDAIPFIKVKDTYSPNIKNKEKYAKLFNEYLKIYKNNKKMFKTLNL